MKEHTRARLLREFPCLNYLGLGNAAFAEADIKVGRVDDALKMAKAMTSEEDYGGQTSARFLERRFIAFTSVDPQIVDEQVIGMSEIEAEGVKIYAESGETVADLLETAEPPVVIIEVNTVRGQHIKHETEIIIHKV